MGNDPVKHNWLAIHPTMSPYTEMSDHSRRPLTFAKESVIKRVNVSKYQKVYVQRSMSTRVTSHQGSLPTTPCCACCGPHMPHAVRAVAHSSHAVRPACCMPCLLCPNTTHAMHAVILHAARCARCASLLVKVLLHNVIRPP